MNPESPLFWKLSATSIAWIGHRFLVCWTVLCYFVGMEKYTLVYVPFCVQARFMWLLGMWHLPFAYAYAYPLRYVFTTMLSNISISNRRELSCTLKWDSNVHFIQVVMRHSTILWHSLSAPTTTHSTLPLHHGTHPTLRSCRDNWHRRRSKWVNTTLSIALVTHTTSRRQSTHCRRNRYWHSRAVRGCHYQ
jgi:hypothetical protein